MSATGADGPPEQGEDPGELRRAGIRGLVRDLLSIDRAALAILVTVPVVLTLLDYYGMPWNYEEHRTRRPMHALWEMRGEEPPGAKLLQDIEMPGPPEVRGYAWWSMCCLVLLVLVPMLVGRLFARSSPRALGLRLKGTGRDAFTYLFLFLIFFPILYWVSLSAEFQRTYPFYKPPDGAIGKDFLVFEVVYCLQFFAVEFFFRGFIVLGLKRVLGWASVLVMLAPYCMIHYYKPMPEAMGAIGAGLVLGALSWRTGTILYGWALHYAVALSMDLLGLYHRGLL
jgi:hypothetical protein